MKPDLQQYRIEMEQELKNILHYWMKNTPDESSGGFIGKIDHDGTQHPEAPKGSVLNSRILWSFSAAFNLTKNETYKLISAKAANYLLNHFVDKKYGGVFWTVDASGRPLDTKKQIYALAFAIYGLSEYVLASGNEAARQEAIQLYHRIVKHSYEPQYGGYIEALARDWSDMGDIRLSDKDANERKSMNTHLHVLEGFANLYRVWPDKGLREKIRELIQLFLGSIISSETNHLRLFFDDAWNAKASLISYGHDIEAAWLVQEATEVIGDAELLQQVKARSLLVAEAAAQGLDTDGGLWYEYDAGVKHLISEKHWWPQAEAMVGFFNAWQITGDEKWLHRSVESWEFVKRSILDKLNGEWVWGIKEDGSIMTSEDKVGIWKCPYHNSRACIEIIRRITMQEELTAGKKPARNANHQSSI